MVSTTAAVPRGAPFAPMIARPVSRTFSTRGFGAEGVVAAGTVVEGAVVTVGKSGGSISTCQAG